MYRLAAAWRLRYRNILGQASISARVFMTDKACCRTASHVLQCENLAARLQAACSRSDHYQSSVRARVIPLYTEDNRHEHFANAIFD